FMSGWYPHVRGHRTMYHMMQPDEPVLLRTLKDEGYFVWWGGKNDLTPGQHWADNDLGKERYCDVRFQPSADDWRRWNRAPSWQMADHRGEPGSDTYYSFLEGRLLSWADLARMDPAGGEGDEEDPPDFGDFDWGNVLGAVDFIKNWDPSGGRPLCIYLPLVFPHPEYRVEEPFFSMIDRSKVPPRLPAPDWDSAGKPSMLKGIAARQNLEGWTEDRWAELRAVYLGMIARVDHQFGLVVQALKEKGIYDETAVFFFSDHGDFTGDYGIVEKNQNTFEDCLSRVPFIIKPPLGIPVASQPGRPAGQPNVCDALVELVDFSATVYDLALIEPGYWSFGRSLLPLLRGDKGAADHRDAVFCEGGRLAGETHCMERESASSTDPRGAYWPRVSLQMDDTGPYHTKAAMCRTRRYKYVMRLYEADELYDLEVDPGESRNRIDDPAMAPVVNELRHRLLKWYMETADVVPLAPDKR
ncbi:MAG: sulfatase-like hydrolase/transferase, partial [Candidatus Lokiarchaeota archaeon]|nr:sulfatase-like hydrolase/transferase [Candidatus Lokiarchaeota archaeon]